MLASLSAGFALLALVDPLTLAGVAMALLVISMIAGLLPARRAATLDPVRAIRTE